MTKIQLRNLWFQFHKWIGLILAVVIIPLCLTGSALVWHDTLDRLLNAERYATSGSATLAPDAYAVSAAKALQGQRIATLRMPEEAGDPVIVSAAPQSNGGLQGPAARTNVYLDPPTARVLEVAGSRSGPVMVMHMLHGTLMIPGMGRAIVGWIGVAMLISCISGIWLWWPTVGKWVRGLRWKRHRNLDTNLHHLMGFWIAIPLFVLSLTGAWISFPSFFGPLVGENGRPMGFGADRAAMARAQPLVTPATPLPGALARAQGLVAGEVTQVTWPSDYKAQWLFSIRPAQGRPANISVDDASGAAKRAPAMDRGQATTARLMRQIHDGTGMGLVWQILIFVGGLIPAALAVTGIIMWWRARVWRAQLAERQKAVARA